MKLLLGSRSSTRRDMLQQAGVPFDVVDAQIDEEQAKGTLTGLGAVSLAMELAKLKALAVEAESDSLVLGADQTLELDDGKVLSKPSTKAEAAAQLRHMSGATHRLHSAAAIAEQGRIVWRGSETVTLRLRQLSDSFVERYLDAEFEQIRWSVGGYRIEGPGVQLFDHIEGSHFAILGLPLLPLLAYLRDRGVLAS